MSDDGDRLKGRQPVIDGTNPAALEAFYHGGMSSFCEAWRKIILSNCKELVRARYTLAGEKISESRIEDLSRLHDNYLDYLCVHLEGRQQREENIKESAGYGA